MNDRIEAIQVQQAQTSIDAAASRSAASGSAEQAAQLQQLVQRKETGADHQALIAAQTRLLAS